MRPVSCVYPEAEAGAGHSEQAADAWGLFRQPMVQGYPAADGTDCSHSCGGFVKGVRIDEPSHASHRVEHTPIDAGGFDPPLIGQRPKRSL